MSADLQLAEAIAELLRPAIVEAVSAVTRETIAEAAPPPQILLSVAESAARAGVHPQTIRRAINRGDLAAVTSLGSHPRIRPDDLDRFLTPKEGKRHE